MPLTLSPLTPLGLYPLLSFRLSLSFWATAVLFTPLLFRLCLLKCKPAFPPLLVSLSLLTSLSRLRLRALPLSVGVSITSPAALTASPVARSHPPRATASPDSVDPVSSLTPYTALTSSIPLVAASISLPASAGSADLLDLLPPDLAATYSDPALLLQLPAPRPSRSRSLHRVPYSEWCLLVRRMLPLGMLSFTADPRCVNGVFAVPKDGDAQRLIIDARPCNLHMRPSPHVSLPTPDLFAQLQPLPNQPELYFGKIDLDNFYHRLRLPEWLRPWFALPRVRAGDVGLVDGFEPSAWVYPCCATLPMGWSHSVFVAQAAHERFLYTRTGLRPQDRIHAAADFRVDRLRHAPYIDDLVLIDHDPKRLDAAISAYCPAAAAAGVPPKMSKVRFATSSGLECLGLQCDGQQLTVGVSVSKLRQLIADTCELLRLRRCTGRVMASLIGRWVWACLVRRPVLSVMSSVFRFAELAGHRVFYLWPTVQRELRVLVALAPLLFADLSLRYWSRVLASDASSDGLGVVASVVSHEDAVAASADLRSQLSVLLRSRAPPSASAPIELSEECEPLAVELPAPLASCRWSTVISSPWRRPEHINSLELRAASAALRWSLSHPDALRVKLLLLVDSQVVHFALLKGRSSSPLLLRRLRAVSSLLLASGVVCDTGWVPSALNPADGPSRFFDV